jgi:hypothetical protein
VGPSGKGVVYNLPIGESCSVSCAQRFSRQEPHCRPLRPIKCCPPLQENPSLAARPSSRSSSGSTTATLAPSNSCRHRRRPSRGLWARLGGPPHHLHHLGEATHRGEPGVGRIRRIPPRSRSSEFMLIPSTPVIIIVVQHAISIRVSWRISRPPYCIL